MKSPRGQVVSKYSAALDECSYSEVASEYYDVLLHPTCADFREASKVFLKRFFASECPKGRIADVGAGRSIVAEFVSESLLLVDKSPEMLANGTVSASSKVLDVEMEPFGISEFDWVFAILADPFNSIATWRHISLALRRGGQCIFVVPSYTWTEKFRGEEARERDGYARFDLRGGRAAFLRSIVLDQAAQERLINAAGLKFISANSVLVKELSAVRSAKILKYLSLDDAILDVYRASKN